jgi:hypothetical protein
MNARTFVLYRHEDVSNVSGTGEVAEVHVFGDGTTAVHWPGDRPSTAVWGSVDDVLATHGHGGKTVLRDPRAPLQRMADYLATGGPHHGVRQPIESWSSSKEALRLEVHTSADDWEGWMTAMGGSSDASVFIDRDDDYFPQERRWTSPDGAVTVMYLVYKGDALQAEAGS